MKAFLIAALPFRRKAIGDFKFEISEVANRSVEICVRCD